MNCLPHARGGVSLILTICSLAPWSSPRPWGCFRHDYFTSCLPWVFPTPVGVFLSCHSPFLPLLGLPHARGGVSKKRRRWYDKREVSSDICVEDVNYEKMIY